MIVNKLQSNAKKNRLKAKYLEQCKREGHKQNEPGLNSKSER